MEVFFRLQLAIWIAGWYLTEWKDRFGWAPVVGDFPQKQAEWLRWECDPCIPQTTSKKKRGLPNHSLGDNFRISGCGCVQTRVCRFWKNILTVFAVCGNGEDKKERLIFRLTFPSAGARTRTWSLLVRSQTLYPVGLHPLDWWPKDSLKWWCCQGFLLKIF